VQEPVQKPTPEDEVGEKIQSYTAKANSGDWENPEFKAGYNDLLNQLPRRSNKEADNPIGRGQTAFNNIDQSVKLLKQSDAFSKLLINPKINQSYRQFLNSYQQLRDSIINRKNQQGKNQQYDIPY
jgi:uncharacterized phage infection (PIP) family protein YhgE